MADLRRYVRTLNPRLPRKVWLLEAGGMANMAGTGMVLPFLVLYLHDVRGLSLTVAGIAAAANAIASLPAGMVGGAVVDRIGPKPTTVAALLVQAVAIACFPLITQAWEAIALQLLMGLGNGAFWPAHASILTQYAPEDRRAAAFSLQRMAMNLGIGVGTLLGGFIADVEEPWTFTALFVLDAVSFALFAGLLAMLPASAPVCASAETGSYRVVFRDRPFVLLMLMNALAISAGIVPLVEFLPAYAKHHGGVSEQAIGWIFFANTMCIVAVQLPISKLLEGRRRMVALAIMCGVWAVSWLAVPVVVQNFSPLGAAWALAGVAALLGFGECFLGPVHGPLVADLAGSVQLGRYMAIYSMSWQLAFVVGAPISGFIMDRWPAALWVVASAACAAAGVWALSLERRIPQQHRLTAQESHG